MTTNPPEISEVELCDDVPVVPILPVVAQVPFFERTATLLAAFLLVAAGALGIALATVHHRSQDELQLSGGARRSQVALSHWLDEGYFHYAGKLNQSPEANSIYRSSTGVYMVSGFIVEKIYSAISGAYSYRVLAVHNQVVAMILSALAGLLAYRMARRFDLDRHLAFTAGAAVVVVIFTFPDNLDLYWEMSAQAYALLFALIYLLVEERSVDLTSRPRAFLLVQAAAVFLMAAMEGIAALGFVAAIGATTVIVRRGESWKRFALVVALPCVAAVALAFVQTAIADRLHPDASVTGSSLLFRTGLDGDATFYGDHLGVAKRRDVARGNWSRNREHLFRWKWVFVLGLVSTLAILIAFLRDRAPLIAVETLAALIGSWILYAAIFSQAVIIHPYLYDVLLFTPLCVALFALAPSLIESLTRRTGVIFLVIAFTAVWYSFFQLRLYSLRRPLPPPSVEAAP